MAVTDELRNEVRAYLERHIVMTLATTGDDGPWGAAVYYVSDGWAVEFLSAPHTRHARNAEASGRAAATIQDQDADWQAIQGIQLEGAVRRLDGPERDAAVRRYGVKFSYLPFDDPALLRALDGIAWYRLEPDSLLWIDNARSFGARATIVPETP